MTSDRSTHFSFTKLVVHDLDAMADYYCSVFGLHRGFHESFEDGVGGTLVGKIKELPEHGIRTAFARDPEGHLNELVEMRR